MYNEPKIITPLESVQFSLLFWSFLQFFHFWTWRIQMEACNIFRALKSFSLRIPHSRSVRSSFSLLPIAKIHTGEQSSTQIAIPSEVIPVSNIKKVKKKRRKKSNLGWNLWTLYHLGKTNLLFLIFKIVGFTAVVLANWS